MTIRDEKRATGLVIRMIRERIPFSVTYGEGVVYIKDHTLNKGGKDDEQQTNTCAEFTAFCKAENLVMTGLLKGYMRLYMEEHYRNQKILEKARLVPVYKSNYDRNDEA